MLDRKIFNLFCYLFLFLSIFVPLMADEGMYLLNKIDQELLLKMKKMGLEVPLEGLYNDQGTGLASAVINIGATASFVSPKGLIITAHHVAERAVLRISTPEKNYHKNGFLARSLSEEAPASGYRVLVPVSIRNVTAEVLSEVKKGMNDDEREMAIMEKIKEIVRKVEKKDDLVCEIKAMNYGLEYHLFSFFNIKDIRVVYVPPVSIGYYGGDTDNFMWPRHCGEFAFLRAYVGPDGKPAEYSENNVPYMPKSYLKVSAKGIKENDLTIVMGFPRQTNRHITSFVLEMDQVFRYPYEIKTAEDLIQIYEDLSQKNNNAALKLSSTINRLSNRHKSNQGMLEGLIKTDLLKKKRAEEKAFLDFLKGDPELEKKYGYVLSQIEGLYQKQRKNWRRNAFFEWIGRGSPLLSVALTINEWSIERQKENNKSEPGYQEKDLSAEESRLKEMHRNVFQEADKKVLEYFLKEALALPANQKIKAVERIVDQTQTMSQELAIKSFLENIFRQSKITSIEESIKMLYLDREDLLNLNDPLIQFAAELEEERKSLKEESNKITASLARLMRAYIEGIEIWRARPLYPDANGTLRLSYGKIRGYSPRDAVKFGYLTSLRGVVEKHTGEEPFNCPKELLDLYQNKDYESYTDTSLGDVPVNFISDNDGAGGNSGSPIVNARGELIGVMFDSNYEAMYSSYYFNPKIARKLHTDMRYVLFIAEKVHRAFNVLDELTIMR